MKVLLSWVKEYLDLNLSSDKIAEILTLAGIEVEAIEEKAGDFVFDISLTPNLGHCMSIVGLARELAALINLKIKRRKIAFTEDPKSSTKKMITIEIDDAKNCHRFASRLIRNVKVGPSPSWLKQKLESCGYRSINNVVDVGNYVMLECGQPLHMFDYDKISGKKLRITSNGFKGSLVTLDDQERKIPEGVLLICDTNSPISFAGVMGGKHSAVSDQTKNVLIESAFFNPDAIRKSSKLLGLRTEGSTRFERGADPLGVVVALERAAELLVTISSGEAATGFLEEVATPYISQVLQCRISRVNQLLGTHLSIREVAEFFERLEIKIDKEISDQLVVTIPSYRHDLKAEIDLIEEIARLYGYNHIPKRHPRHISSIIGHSPIFLFEEEVRTKLLSFGLQEFLTCDLISPSQAKLTSEKTLNESAQISVLHPRSVDQSVLRTSLLPGLLQVIKLNLNHQMTNIAGFEVGKIHFKENENYLEHSDAAIILSGKSHPYHWNPKPQEFDFFDLKGITEDLFANLGIDLIIFERSHLQNFHPQRQSRIKIGDAIVGVLGEIHPLHLKEYGIDQKVYFAEWNLTDLFHLRKKEIKVAPLPAFPGSTRDLTISIKDELPVGAITNLFHNFSSRFLEKIEFFELYKSKEIGKDIKNVTFRFYYRDKEKTIELEEVNVEHARVQEKIRKELKDYLIE